MYRLALLMLPVLALPIRAETIVVDSLEWRTVEAPLIVRGKVTRSQEVKVADDQRAWHDITVAITESLKGDLAGKTLVFRTLSQDAWAEHEYLFFLCRWHKDHWNEGNTSALKSQITQTSGGAIDLDSPHQVYTADQTYARTAREILDIVRRSAKLPTGGRGREVGADPTKRGTLKLNVEVHFDAPIHAYLYAGSAVLLVVPADEKRKSEGLMMLASMDPHIRAAGARRLAHYPGPATIKELRERLKDTGQVEVIQAGKLILIRYPVRQAAYESLLNLGEKPDKPVFERNPTGEEARQATQPE
jgi:hypothetical protein